MWWRGSVGVRTAILGMGVIRGRRDCLGYGLANRPIVAGCSVLASSVISLAFVAKGIVPS